MGTGRTRDRMQATRDRHGKASSQHVGTPRARRGATLRILMQALEELHLLDGELWIDGRKLFPGDYNYGAPGAGDERVWSRDRLHLPSRYQYQRYPALTALWSCYERRNLPQEIQVSQEGIRRYIPNA